MIKVSMTTTIHDSADAVWKTISDFNGLGKYLSMIKSSTMDGSGVGAVRHVTLQDGTQLSERLVSFDEKARTLSYSIGDSPLPLKDYMSIMKVRDLGNNRCELEWSSTFEPRGASEADAKNLIEGAYSLGFEGLRKIHER
jgi:hypothetical protein